MIENMKSGLMQEVERFFVLSQTDGTWKEHLQSMKFLQQSVGLRGYAQRDPLTEFKLEGYNLFMDMTARKRRNVIYNVYMFQPAKIVPEDMKEEVEGAKSNGATGVAPEKTTAA